MSFSANRRDALDRDLPFGHRASHARSCAMLVAQKWRVKRSVVLKAIQKKCGVDLATIRNDKEIETAIQVLEDLKLHGLPSVDDAEPSVVPDCSGNT